MFQASEESSRDSSWLIFFLRVTVPVPTEVLQQQHLNLRTADITHVVAPRSGAESLVASLLLQLGATG